MQVGLDDDLYKQLDDIAEKLGITTDALVEIAVEQLIKSMANIDK